MNVGPLARWYRFVEYCAFGQALERRRFAYLNRLKAAGSILVLGEGDGRALARLREVAPQASIEVVELSAEMIALARRRINGLDRIQFRREDARSIDFIASAYDGIVTCFFLDCFSEAEARDLIHRLARALRPGGIWLMSDFAIPEHGWRRWHASIWVFTMYRFFQLLTELRTSSLPPIAKLFTEAGLVRTAHQEERAGMMVSEVWTR